MMRDSTSEASSPNVSPSLSAKTGFAPPRATEFAVATKVNEGTITSVPDNPCASIKVCSADVPELNYTQYFLPTTELTADSNS